MHYLRVWLESPVANAPVGAQGVDALSVLAQIGHRLALVNVLSHLPKSRVHAQ